MKAIVTGGAGFIGSHIAERLVNEGYSVTVIDNLHTGDKKNLKKISEKIKFVQKAFPYDLGNHIGKFPLAFLLVTVYAEIP